MSFLTPTYLCSSYKLLVSNSAIAFLIQLNFCTAIAVQKLKLSKFV